MVSLRAENLASRLRALGVIDPEQLDQAKRELATSEERFSAILFRLGVIRDVDAGKRLAPQVGAIPQRLPASPTPPDTQSKVPAELWRQHRFAPFQEQDGKLWLATDDPFSVFALELFQRRCGCDLVAVLVSERDLVSLWEGTFVSEGAPAAGAAQPVAPPVSRPPQETAPAAPAACRSLDLESAAATPSPPALAAAPFATAAHGDVAVIALPTGFNRVFVWSAAKRRLISKGLLNPVFSIRN